PTRGRLGGLVSLHVDKGVVYGKKRGFRRVSGEGNALYKYHPTPLLYGKMGYPRHLPSSRQSGLTMAAFTARVRVRQHQASADNAGVAPEGIDGGVGLTAVLQTAEGSLIDAGAFGHDRQGQSG